MPEISSEVDQITFKRLILVRQIFSRGVSQLDTAHNFADKIIGLVSLDLANETLLKVIIANQPSKSNEANFHNLIVEVNSFLRERHLGNIPDEGNIKRVHKLRNVAQHDAECPNDATLNDCRTYTNDFLKKAVLKVWRIDFESLNLIELVQTSFLRELLQKANGEFQDCDYTNATFDAIAAFDRMIGATKFAIVGNDSTFFRIYPDMVESAQLQSIVKNINELRVMVMHSVLGIDFREYSKYRDVTKGMFVNWLGGDRYPGTLSRGPVSEVEAVFVLDFVTNTIVNVESIVGDIEKPFGIEG